MIAQATSAIRCKPVIVISFNKNVILCHVILKHSGRKFFVRISDDLKFCLIFCHSFLSKSKFSFFLFVKQILTQINEMNQMNE